jgi:hypothetical protein
LACDENVAFGVQYCWQPAQAFPVSQASKKLLAVAVMLDI